MILDSELEVRLATNGDGYEQLSVADGPTLQHHRLLLWAWDRLESPWFSGDPREVHHVRPIEWLNTPGNLEAMSPAEHMEVDPDRARIRGIPWDGVGRADL